MRAGGPRSARATGWATSRFNYHWDGRTLAFSSEMHAILALPWVKTEFNEGMLAEFLAVEWVRERRDVLEGRHAPVAAHWMEVRAGGLRQDRVLGARTYGQPAVQEG